MTHEEMIAIIQAHKEGKIIQFKIKDKKVWYDLLTMDFDFTHYDYRIKPEPHYRPFKNTEEIIDAVKEHGTILKEKGYFRYVSISQWDIQYVQVNREDCGYISIFNRYTFADGTPFGVKED